MASNRITIAFTNYNDPEQVALFNKVTKCIGVSKRSKFVYTVPKNIFNDIILLGHEDTSRTTMVSPVISVQNWITNHKILHDYQKTDILYSLNRRYVLNRNPMGLGKTVEAILWLSANNFRNALVIVPKNLKEQWLSQFKKWTDKYWKYVHILQPNERIKLPGVYIIHYEMLPKLLKEDSCIRSKLWDAVVADEAHKLKNVKAQRTQVFMQIPALHTYLLTGTPIMNKVDDLYSILRCLSPYYSGDSYWQFVEKFCHIQETPFGKNIAGITHDPFYAELLYKVLQIISIHNPNVQLTPGKCYQEIKLDMFPEQQALYDQVRTAALDLLYENHPDATFTNGLTQIIKLQQISSCPSLFKIGKGRNVKFDYLLTLLEENPTVKIVVFSRFRTTIESLEAWLPPYMKVQCVHGGIPPEERLANIETFKKNAECRVLCGTVQAMSEGIDGLQYVTNTVIFLDKPDSPQMVRQAEDRICRQGQEEITQIISLICSPIDEKIGKRNLSKLEDIKELLA